MAGRGIRAQHAGKCPACGQGFEAGDLIEKIAWCDDKRGHLACAQGHPPQSYQHPAQQQQQQQPPQQQAAPAPYVHPSSAPATIGPRAQAAPAAGAFDVDTAAALWTLKNAMTLIAQGAMQAAVAIEQMANAKDPHGVTAPRKDVA